MPDGELRERLDAVHAAAERLVRETEGRVPPRGWDVPPEDKPQGDPFGAPELAAVAGLLELVRTAVPPELSHQLRDALRELLMAVRALIDWYLDRMERPGGTPAEVEDIPID